MSEKSADQPFDPVKYRDEIKKRLFASQSVRPSEISVYLTWYEESQRTTALRELIGDSGEMDRKVLKYFFDLEAPSSLDDVLNLVEEVKTFREFWPNLELLNIMPIDVYREQALRLFLALAEETSRKAKSQLFLDITHLPSRYKELRAIYDRLVLTFNLSSDSQLHLLAQLPSDEQLVEFEKHSDQAIKDEMQRVADDHKNESAQLVPVEQLLEQLTYGERMLLRKILYDRGLEALYLKLVQHGSELYRLVTLYLYPDGSRNGNVVNFLKDLLPPN